MEPISQVKPSAHNKRRLWLPLVAISLILLAAFKLAEEN